tara:strand:- start:914 stop:1516 length:603 start_codon:yes stop_codon:yes gene_type:complete
MPKVSEGAEATFKKTVTVESTDDASSKTTGAVMIAGGLGVEKKLHTGEKLTVDTGGVTVTAGGITVTAGAVYARGGAILPQGAQATTDDGTAILSAANIATRIIQCTPAADRSKATDTAANIIAACGLTANNDAFDFSVINLATDGTSHITITFGATGITGVGCAVVSAQDLAEDAFTSGVGTFRFRRTSATAGTIFRIG